ncbi:LPXTG cell wall anchor domain-containing protein [Periweissella cryptocerci]|uniref:LPXTG cell wall anchor domain-containing protein n=1 Tax=Periweissella cryptocerci TaxID=2506420 RepID=A0A4P6YRG9_9LACO|nr:LPXTG cell wall anchor domain-containing protein [Periweissella cryptocerci]QBO35192.1 LPXTG cell wall anchor domain-containing protein [Periweissella cryptocerci]
MDTKTLKNGALFAGAVVATAGVGLATQTTTYADTASDNDAAAAKNAAAQDTTTVKTDTTGTVTSSTKTTVTPSSNGGKLVSTDTTYSTNDASAAAKATAAGNNVTATVVEPAQSSTTPTTNAAANAKDAAAAGSDAVITSAPAKSTETTATGSYDQYTDATKKVADDNDAATKTGDSTTTTISSVAAPADNDKDGDYAGTTLPDVLKDKNEAQVTNDNGSVTTFYADKDSYDTDKQALDNQDFDVTNPLYTDDMQKMTLVDADGNSYTGNAITDYLSDSSKVLYDVTNHTAYKFGSAAVVDKPATQQDVDNANVTIDDTTGTGTTTDENGVVTTYTLDLDGTTNNLDDLTVTQLENDSNRTTATISGALYYKAADGTVAKISDASQMLTDGTKYYAYDNDSDVALDNADFKLANHVYVRTAVDQIAAHGEDDQTPSTILSADELKKDGYTVDTAVPVSANVNETDYSKVVAGSDDGSTTYMVKQITTYDDESTKNTIDNLVNGLELTSTSADGTTRYYANADNTEFATLTVTPKQNKTAGNVTTDIQLVVTSSATASQKQAVDAVDGNDTPVNGTTVADTTIDGVDATITKTTTVDATTQQDVKDLLAGFVATDNVNVDTLAGTYTKADGSKAVVTVLASATDSTKDTTTKVVFTTPVSATDTATLAEFDGVAGVVDGNTTTYTSADGKSTLTKTTQAGSEAGIVAVLDGYDATGDVTDANGVVTTTYTNGGLTATKTVTPVVATDGSKTTTTKVVVSGIPDIAAIKNDGYSLDEKQSTAAQAVYTKNVDGAQYTITVNSTTDDAVAAQSITAMLAGYAKDSSTTNGNVVTTKYTKNGAADIIVTETTTTNATTGTVATTTALAVDSSVDASKTMLEGYTQVGASNVYTKTVAGVTSTITLMTGNATDATTTNKADIDSAIATNNTDVATTTTGNTTTYTFTTYSNNAATEVTKTVTTDPSGKGDAAAYDTAVANKADDQTISDKSFSAYDVNSVTAADFTTPVAQTDVKSKTLYTDANTQTAATQMVGQAALDYLAKDTNNVLYDAAGVAYKQTYAASDVTNNDQANTDYTPTYVSYDFSKATPNTDRIADNTKLYTKSGDGATATYTLALGTDGKQLSVEAMDKNVIYYNADGSIAYKYNGTKDDTQATIASSLTDLDAAVAQTSATNSASMKLGTVYQNADKTISAEMTADSDTSSTYVVTTTAKNGDVTTTTFTKTKQTTANPITPDDFTTANAVGLTLSDLEGAGYTYANGIYTNTATGSQYKLVAPAVELNANNTVTLNPTTDKDMVVYEYNDGTGKLTAVNVFKADGTLNVTATKTYFSQDGMISYAFDNSTEINDENFNITFNLNGLKYYKNTGNVVAGYNPASYNADNGVVTLTDAGDTAYNDRNNNNESGNVTFKDASMEINFDGDFDFKGAVNLGDKSQQQGGADGVTFAFNPSTDVSAKGSDGGSMGIGDLPGAFGFKLDTYLNETKPGTSRYDEHNPYYNMDPTGADYDKNGAATGQSYGSQTGNGNAFGAFMYSNPKPEATLAGDKTGVVSTYTGDNTKGGDIIAAPSQNKFGNFEMHYSAETHVMTVSYTDDAGVAHEWSRDISDWLQSGKTYSFIISASTGGSSNVQQVKWTSMTYTNSNSVVKQATGTPSIIGAPQTYSDTSTYAAQTTTAVRQYETTNGTKVQHYTAVRYDSATLKPVYTWTTMTTNYAAKTTTNKLKQQANATTTDTYHLAAHAESATTVAYNLEKDAQTTQHDEYAVKGAASVKQIDKFTISDKVFGHKYFSANGTPVKAYKVNTPATFDEATMTPTKHWHKTTAYTWTTKTTGTEYSWHTPGKVLYTWNKKTQSFIPGSNATTPRKPEKHQVPTEVKTATPTQVTQKLTPAAETPNVVKASILPQTGDSKENTVLSVIGLAMLGFMGLAGVAKRRKQD